MNIFSKNILALLGGLAVALFLAELGGQIFLPRPVRNKLPVILNQADTVCGYHPKPNQKGYGLSGKITINRWGFRGKDWEKEKKPGNFRSALLGDSYAFSQGVHDEEAFANILEQVLNEKALKGTHFETLNFAVPGYDTGHEIKVLEHHAVAFQPDMVLLQFFINDLVYIEGYEFYPRMFEQMNRDFSIWKWQIREWGRTSPLAMKLWDIARSNDKGLMRDIIQDYVERNRMPPAGAGSKGWSFVVERFQHFHELSERYHFQAVLIIMPTPQEIIRGQEAAYSGFLKEKAKEQGIISINLLEGLHAKPSSKLLIPYDYHLSVEGNRLTGEFLAEFLSKKVFKK